jgi:hypothetical protein
MLRGLPPMPKSFGGYRVERTSSWAGVALHEDQRISRRTLTPTDIAPKKIQAWVFYNPHLWMPHVRN